MNILNKVTLKTLLENRTRTIVTIIGIMLASALICGVTTFVSSFYDTLIGNAKYEQGDYHKFFYRQDKDFYEQIAGNERVDTAAFIQELGYFPLPDSSRMYFYLIGTDGNFDEKNMAIHVSEGKYPSSTNEIMFPNIYSEEYSIGDTVTIDIGERWYDGKPVEQLSSEFEADQYIMEGEELRTTETRTYTVSGFYNFNNWYASTLCMHASMGWPAVTLADKGMPEGYTYDVFVKLKNPADALNFYENALYSGRNDTLLTYMGVTPFDALNFTIWGFSALVIVIVMVGSVSLIYNAFAISVSERTKQFGLLSSVGATKKQLRRTVLFEAFVVSVIGIPLGAVMGIGIVALALVFMGDLFDSMALSVPVELRVSMLALVIGMGVSLLTVLISAWIPSKRATMITAIEAIRQNKDITAAPVKTSKLTAKLFGLPGVLAAKYYKRSKKRYKATVVSLFISIVLFISTSAFGDYFVDAIFYNSDIYNYDLEAHTSSEAFNESFTPDMLLEEYKKAEGVTAAAYAAWGDPSEDANGGSSGGVMVGIDKSYITSAAIERGRVSDKVWGTSDGVKSDSIRFISANITFVEDGAFKELLAQYGLSEAEFINPDKPLAVVLDGNRMYDSDTGRYLETRVLNSDRAEIIAYAYDVPREEGFTEYDWRNDKDGNYYISVIDTDRNHNSGVVSENSYEIMAEKVTMNVGKVIYELPYFINVRFADLNVIYPISLIGKVCPKWEGMYPHYYLICSDNHAVTFQAIEAINESHGIYASINDYAERVEGARGVINTVQTAVYVFIGIIALISVANVFNTISTNIGLRRREFAMLKSVGMTSGGFNRMMIYESILYGVKSLLYGLPVAVVITLVIHFVIGCEFDMGLRMPWGAMGITMLSVFTAVVITMMYALRKVKKANPIDELKNENI